MSEKEELEGVIKLADLYGIEYDLTQEGKEIMGLPVDQPVPKKKLPKYGTLERRAYQYQRMKEENRGKNFEYWNEEKHEKMLDEGWDLYLFPNQRTDLYSTSCMLCAKEIVEQLRSEGNFARIIAGRDQNVQRTKMFSIIFKPKKKKDLEVKD